MPTNETDYNYPDVLGYLTGMERLNINIVQAAMTVRPRVVRAGRPFEVIMLLQNAADCPVDVTVTLTVPEKDAKGNKGRFLVGTERLVVGLEAAEVGMVKLPVSTMPDTAVSESYSLTMDLDVKPLEKANRIRANDGGGAFDPSHVPSDRREHLEALKQLTYSVKKRGGLFRGGNSVELNFALLPGKVGKIAKLNAGWESLWKVEDNQDDTMFVERYGELIRVHTVPALRRSTLYPILLEKNAKRFETAGYPLTEIENSLVARLMTLILEYANSKEMVHTGIEAGIYDVRAVLNPKERMIQVELPKIPHWLSGFLRAVAKDERVARVPAKAIPHFVYDELLLDALTLAFQTIEVSTGEDLGTPEEMDEYAAGVITALRRKGKMDFTHAYMPLVLGGVLLFDRVLIGDEQLKDVLAEIRILLRERASERNEDNDAIFDMASLVVNHTLKKFGMYDQ